MNKDNAHLFIPLIQALAEGKKIQMRSGNHWKTQVDPRFTNEPDYYRIKPEPVYRPWSFETAPRDRMVWLRGKKGSPRDCLVSRWEIEWVGLSSFIYRYVDLFENWVQLDGTPCGELVPDPSQESSAPWGKAKKAAPEEEEDED